MTKYQKHVRRGRAVVRFAGAVIGFMSSAGCSGGEDAPTAPGSPPTITRLEVTPTIPVDAYVNGFTVRVEASDPDGITRAEVHVSGAQVHHDSILVRPASSDIKRDFLVQESIAVQFGIPMNVEVVVTDSLGSSARRSLSFVAYEREAPAVELTLPANHRDSTYDVGDVLSVRVTATDNDRLAWIGLQDRGGNRLDSVAVTTGAGTLTTQLQVTLDRMLVHGQVEGWATDRSGNTALSAPQALELHRWRTHTAAYYLRPVPIAHMVADEKRQRIYIAATPASDDEESVSSVDVFDLDQGVFLAPLLINTRVLSLDLTPSGDSLVVALSNRQALGIIDLTTPGASFSTIPLTGIGNSVMTPRSLRVSDSSVVLTTFVHDGGGLIGTVDLRTGATLFRPDLSGDAIPAETSIHVAGDRSSLFALLPSLPQGRGHMWTRGAFQPGRNMPSVVASHVSWSSDGARFLAGRQVFTRQLVQERELRVPDWGFWYQPVVMIAGGKEAIFGTYFGYVRLGTADNGLIEQVKLPAEPYVCIAFDAERKLACGANYYVGSQVSDALMIVELY